MAKSAAATCDRLPAPADAKLILRGLALAWERRIDHDHQIRAADAANRRDVAHEIERKIGVQRRIDGMRNRDVEERIAVRRRPHDRLGGDVGAGTGTVLDDERLAQLFRQLLRHNARNGVR